jgi:hypothetical protein
MPSVSTITSLQSNDNWALHGRFSSIAGVPEKVTFDGYL